MLPKAIHSHHSQPGLNGPAAPPHLVEQREYIYFTSHVGGDWSVYRQGIADRKLERVVSLNGVQEAQDVAALFPWFGLAPDDSAGRKRAVANDG